LKPHLFPLQMPSPLVFFAGCVALYVGCTVSAAGGVGGGGINVPILLIIFGYSFKTCVVLSLCTVLGNALAQTSVNIYKTHPSNIRSPLIFFEIAAVLLPAQMGGSNIGSILAKMLPDSILYVIAFVVLMYASTVSLMKGIHKWQDETAKQKAKEAVTAPKDTQGTSMHTVDDAKDNHAAVRNPMNKTSTESFNMGENSIDVVDETTKEIQWPIPVLVALTIMWTVYVSISIAVTLESKCSTGYIVAFVFLYVPIVGTIIWAVWNEVKDMNQAQMNSSLIEFSGKFPVKPNEMDFSKVGTQLPIAGFFIGIICSLLGIGGGELLGPLMLSYGVIPQVSSATTSFLSLMNTAATLIDRAAANEIDYNTGPILFAVGFLGGVSGRKLGLFIAARYGRPSVIILALVVALYMTCIYYIFELSTESFSTSLDSFC